MNNFSYQAKLWFDSRAAEAWGLVDSLNRTEWLVMLSAVTVIGFLFLRGFGSRQSY